MSPPKAGMNTRQWRTHPEKIDTIAIDPATDSCPHGRAVSLALKLSSRGSRAEQKLSASSMMRSSRLTCSMRR